MLNFQTFQGQSAWLPFEKIHAKCKHSARALSAISFSLHDSRSFVESGFSRLMKFIVLTCKSVELKLLEFAKIWRLTADSWMLTAKYPDKNGKLQVKVRYPIWGNFEGFLKRFAVDLWWYERWDEHQRKNSLLPNDLAYRGFGRATINSAPFPGAERQLNSPPWRSTTIE